MRAAPAKLESGFFPPAIAISIASAGPVRHHLAAIPMSEIEEHLEHAEHTAHGSHAPDPFMARVGMTMALIAAVLAAVALIGHRKHNTVLQLQGDANRLLTESAAFKVESSNTFARFQAKKGRMEEQERAITFAKIFPITPGTEELRDAEVKKWESYIAKNKTLEKDIPLDDKTKFPAKNADGSENDTAGALVITGKRFQALAAEREEEAGRKSEESEHVHHQADRLDWAHLAVELGLVLCTVSILTKARMFWLGGIVAALAGVYLAVTALGMAAHESEHAAAVHESSGAAHGEAPKAGEAAGGETHGH